MEPIKKFFECLIPVTACNLKCSYCYVIQRNNRKNKLPEMKYSIQTIKKSLSKKRLGGACYFSICGAGETLIPEETLQITEALLDNGHYVNITTNGLLTNRIEKLLEMPKEFLERLQVAFSFHYLELKRLNKMNIFFENVNKVKSAGCSILVQLNLCDEYIPYIDEIKEICLEKVGAYPQIAATREEDINSKVKLMTSYSKEEYEKYGNMFDSNLFKFTMENFNVKRNEFCYAGEWTFSLNLATGVLRRCYNSIFSQNIFENPEEPIRFCAVGKACNSVFCMNSSHFMSLGVIPEKKCPTYLELRNRSEANWYNDKMKEVLSLKLNDTNELYTNGKKMKSICIGYIDKIGYSTWRILNRLKRK